MHKALILGCGPSGLLAAHAAKLAGWTPIIVSVKKPSPLFGCQYLHQLVPGLRPGGGGVSQAVVEYKLRGEIEGYAYKVYGPEQHPSLKVSPESLVGSHPAWDIRQAYEYLWDTYQGYIDNERLQADDVKPMLDYFRPNLFVNTIPMPLLCANEEHDFRSVKCYAIGDAPELGQYAPKVAPSFTVICDGSDDVGWYRASNVFGYTTIEWPGWRSKPPVSGVVDFLKPLWTNCDCWESLGMRRLGRMGKWKKGVLAHHSFDEMQRLISSHDA